MKVTLNKIDEKSKLLSRKKRRQFERKLIKAKRNAWHHGKKFEIFILSIRIKRFNLDSNVNRYSFPYK